MYFFKNKEDIVGIYIEDKAISICQLKPGPKAEVAGIIDVSLPEKTVQAGMILEPAVLIKTLKEAFRKNNIRTKKVAVAISDLPLIVRSTFLPKVSKDKIKEALKPEVSRYMIGEEPIVDYYLLEKNKILLFCIKKVVADSILSVMNKSELDLVAIDVPSLAVLRTLIGSNIEQDSKDTHMLALISPNKTELSFIRGCLPHYIHSISTSNIPDIAKEIELTKKSWQEESPQFPIGKTIIIGNNKETESLYDELSDKTGVLETAKPLGRTQEEYSLSHAVSIGLSLRGRQARSFDINFIPLSKYKQLLREKKILAVFIPFLLIITIFFIMNIVFSNKISYLQKKLATLEQEMDVYKNVPVEIEQLYTTKESLDKDINLREEFIGKLNPVPLEQILEDIRRFIPKEVWLTKISNRTEGSIILTGESLSEEAVYKYVNLLYFSNLFNKPEISSLTTKDEEGSQAVYFSIICPLLGKNKPNEN